MTPWEPTRRTLLQAAAGWGIALTAAPSVIAATGRQAPPRVDTHLHCFAGLKDPRFPYHQRAPYRPAEEATPESLLACMEGAEVAFAVVVHPEPYQDDHRYLLHCLEVGKGRLKGVVLLFADRPGSLDQMPRLAANGNVAAVRVHAYAPDRLPPFGQPELKRLWSMATELGLAVQIHFEPRYAPGFEPLLKEFPDTRVIIDHLGRPFQGTPQEHAVVVRWSQFPQTVMKLSAIPEPRSYPHREIGPIIRQLADAYGPDRMMFGGGFGAGATPESYRQAFERGQSYLDHLSAADQAKILGGTAARFFGFGDA
ncbi:amidohydrolase family protein [Lignipirellula cremea]|uniref:4-sulfomuconolactone hydrolase n=1 Tax=Lignipirellula cremea TaxID=2528010 RepID=A0A518DZ65_9BACT|nr:amidohydrolase family protein [Lignipirellula cremea]QDU97124.1 4-sulfomuconolactone hydrolase [Lignipirellula cremea]